MNFIQGAIPTILVVQRCFLGTFVPKSWKYPFRDFQTLRALVGQKETLAQGREDPPASRCEARLPTPGTGGQALRAGGVQAQALLP